MVRVMPYFEGSYMPDMYYVIHQCARFSHESKIIYEAGVKHITQYLREIRKRGIKMKPGNKNLHLYIYGDVDFASFFASEDRVDPVSVKSRTGILLNFEGEPIPWSSKIQRQIALLILESEYIAISQGIRESVVAKRFVLELETRLNMTLRIYIRFQKLGKTIMRLRN